ncbi:MAG: LytTR family transcriptional regulator [Clostridia bacterium]|nr:LytTR family transcriptional regulator [Clostridia bacterium]
MKFRFLIDKNREEEVIVYAHKKTKLVESIENIVKEDNFELIGYADREAVKLDLADVYCFTVENNKIYAVCENEKYLLKSRLYQVEENLSENFIKINQSCIANIRKIRKFDASFSGTLTVIFKNGYKDFVSRRNVKNVKERLGL